MPKFTFTSPDGKSFTVEGPEGSTSEQAFSMLQTQLGAQQQASPQGPATDRQEYLASAPVRLARGMKDPIDGAAQMLARTPIAGPVNRAGDAIGDFLNRNIFNTPTFNQMIGAPENYKGDFAGDVLGFRGKTAEQMDKEIKDAEVEYQSARQATTPRTLSSLITGEKPDPGTDWMRLGGNLASPMNAALGKVLPGAGASNLRRATVGAAGGSLAGMLQPVYDTGTDGEDFAGKKAVQAGFGAALGGIAAPVVGKVTDRVAQWFANNAARRAATRPPSAEDVEQIARSVAADTSTRWQDMSGEMQKQMRDQVAKAMQSAGGRQDPVTLARLRDFKAEGMDPTLGQITRDPRQFATEMNLRQVPGTGDPLLQRMQQQGAQMQEKVGKFGQGAAQDYKAGNQLMAPLRAYDEKLSADVRTAYRAARDSAGKDAELPLQGLAQDAADVLDNFGDKVPSGVMNQLRKYGIVMGQEGSAAPRKLFTVEEADKLLKVINASGSRTDDATNAALTQLRGAVKKAVSEPGAEDVFAPARKLAAERFGLHDSVDALAQVARGKASPDTFVDRFLVNAETNQATRLAEILKKESPEAYQQARAQIGAKLGRAAFGENVTGDKAFATERFAKTLNDLGDDKLTAFFSQQEIDQLHRLARLGAYINQAPNKAPVNTSGNWAAIQGIAARIPGIGPTLGLIKSAKAAIDTNNGVQRALTAEVPIQPAKIDPATAGRLSQLLSSTGVGAGAGAGGAAK